MTKKLDILRQLDCFFNPQSVAVIGASRTPSKFGHIILKNFVRGSFQGKIYPVNPNTDSILGIEVYPSVKKIPEKVDLAVIVTPAKTVPKILDECAEAGVRCVVIISAGFSEIGKQGQKLEEQCRKIIKNKKIRVVGPNCIGVYDTLSGVDTFFLPKARLGRPKKGEITFISQSGAVGSTILDWLSEEKIGISKFVSYGNAIDINETDLLEYFAEDEKTKVIAMYLEGIKSSGEEFIKIAKKTVKKKPLIVLKSGKTERGIAAVASHTGSLAGVAKIYSGAFKQSGIIEANNWEELFDFARALSTQPLPEGDNLAIVTDGGGFGVLATDEAERENIKLKEPSKGMRTILRKKMPAYVSLYNPIDLTGDATAERYAITISEAMKEFDGIMAITLFQLPTIGKDLVEEIIELSKKYNKPILCCATGGDFTKRMIKKLEEGSIPVYPTPERAVRAFNAMVKYSSIKKNSNKK